MVTYMDMKKAVSFVVAMAAVAVFAYPIVKMTLSAMDNNVNLYPIFMVIFSVVLALVISKLKK